MNLVSGSIYKVTHSRKGTFKMRFESESGEWITGTVFQSRAKAAMSYNEKEHGEEITVRRDHCLSIQPEGIPE